MSRIVCVHEIAPFDASCTDEDNVFFIDVDTAPDYYKKKLEEAIANENSTEISDRLSFTFCDDPDQFTLLEPPLFVLAIVRLYIHEFEN